MSVWLKDLTAPPTDLAFLMRSPGTKPCGPGPPAAFEGGPCARGAPPSHSPAQRLSFSTNEFAIKKEEESVEMGFPSSAAGLGFEVTEATARESWETSLRLGSRLGWVTEGGLWEHPNLAERGKGRPPWCQCLPECFQWVPGRHRLCTCWGDKGGTYGGVPSIR